MRAIDFNLRPVRTVNVRGRIVSPFPAAQAGAAGRNSDQGVPPGLGIFVQGTQVSLSRAGVKAALASLGVGGAAANADGTFEVRGVVPGSYILTAMARQPNAPVYTARMRVEVGDADLGNIVMALRPGVSIRGRVVWTQRLRTSSMNQLRVTCGPPFSHLFHEQYGPHGWHSSRRIPQEATRCATAVTCIDRDTPRRRRI
jgi:hypothetical protein